MKGIAMKGNNDLFSIQNLPKYINLVIDYCTIVQ